MSNLDLVRRLQSLSKLLRILEANNLYVSMVSDDDAARSEAIDRYVDSHCKAKRETEDVVSNCPEMWTEAVDPLCKRIFEWIERASSSSPDWYLEQKGLTRDLNRLARSVAERAQTEICVEEQAEAGICVDLEADKGYRARDIVRLTGRTRSTVYRWIKAEMEDQKDRKRDGRNPVFRGDTWEIILREKGFTVNGKPPEKYDVLC